MESNKSFPESNTDITEELNNVMKNIYTSCDLTGSNQVNTSKLITFIEPYMVQDLSALEKLKLLLDPNNEDKPISSTEFYEAMKDWAKQVSDSTDEGDESFNRTPSQLDHVDSKELPYVQSTPRASFGQKLLNSSGLLSLSLNSSFSENHNSDEKYVFEEQVKKLNHQLLKVHNEMVLVKLQLTSAEEQNEILQNELADVKKQLQQEHQHNESLQLKINEKDDLQDDLNAAKQQIHLLETNLKSVQKENLYLNNFITKLKEEKVALENKYQDTCKKEQDAKKLIIDIKTELELKEQDVSELIKLNGDLKSKNQEQKEVLEQYINENELLVHKTERIEKMLHSQATNLRRNSLGCFTTSQGNRRVSLSNSSSQAFYTCNTNNTYNSPKFLQQITHPITPSLNTPPFLHNKALKHLKNESFSNSTPKEQHTEANSVNNNFKSGITLSPISDSPPILYVIERSDETNNAFKENDVFRELSIEDEENFLWKMEQDEPQCSHESLKVEMDKAIEKNASLILFEREEFIANLECMVESLKHEKNNLKHELDKIKTTNEEIEQKNQIVKENLREKEKQLESLQGLRSKLEEHIELNQMLKKTIKTFELALENKSKEINDLKISLEQDNATKNALWANMQALTSDHLDNSKLLDEQEENNLQAKVESLIDLNNNLNQELEKIKTTNTDIEQKNRLLNDILSEKEDQLKALEVIKLQLEEQVKLNQTLENKIKNLEETVNNKSKEITDLKKSLEENNGSKMALSELKLEMEQLKIQQMEELKTNESIISNLKIDKKNTDSIINEIIQCIKSHLTNIQIDENNNVEQLKHITNILINKYEEQKKIKLKSDQSNDSFEQKGFSYEKQRIILEKHQEKIEKLENVCNNNNRRLMNMNKERDNLLNRLTILEKQLMDKEKQLEDKENQHSQLVILLKQRILQQTNELHLTKQNVRTLILNNEQLQSDYHKIEFELSAKNKEIQNLNKEKSELHIINAEIKEQLSSEKLEYLKLLSKNEEFEDFLKNRNNIQEELKNLERKLLDEKEELASLTDFGIIYNKKETLLRIINNWKKTPNIIGDEFCHFLNEFPVDPTEAGNFSTSTEWEIYKLKVVLDFAILLTDFLSEKFSNKHEIMNMNPEQNLKPRTESPDSPFEIENNLSNSIFNLDFPINDAKNIQKFTIPNLRIQAPNGPSLDLNIHGDDNSINEVSSNSEMIPPNQEASPNLSESFLESVSLHESSSFKKLDRTELEDVFVKLVMQLSFDWSDTKDRKLKQQERCTKMETQLLNVIKDITYRLRDHKCIGAQDPIIPVFLMLEEVKNLIKELIKSAGQYGAICYELRMMKCWNLAINYTAMLKQSTNNNGVSSSASSPTKHNVATQSPKTDGDMEIKKRKCVGRKISSGKHDIQITSRVVPKRQYCQKLMFAFMLIFLCIVCLLLLEIYCNFSESCENFSFFKYSLMGPLAY